jgi:N,N'-diacetyllegionaminate synthase
MSVFVIAEAGVNHNGDEGRAMELVQIAARCGADAVKFQTFRAEKLVVRGAEKAEYQRLQTGTGDQYDMLKALELSDDLQGRLYERSNELGIEFMSTPFDEESALFLLKLGMKRVKIPSGEITNEPFLEFLARQDVPLILSTGMASMDEVKRAISVIGEARKTAGLNGNLASVLTVLHCTSNYPAECRDVNLRAMVTIAEETGLPVGYSDHTLGVAVSTAAVALGATVIEKHFTIDKTLPGPDHQASLDPEELRMLVAQIRDVDVALGSVIKQPSPTELPVRSLVRRSVTVIEAVAAGSALQRAQLALLRPGTGIAPGDLANVVGKRARRDLAAGTTLQWSDVE